MSFLDLNGAKRFKDNLEAYFRTLFLTLSGGTVKGALTANNGITVNGTATVKGQGMEIYGSTPFIDFHYANSTSDYTSRIIARSSTTLEINGFTIDKSTGNGVFSGTVTAKQHLTSSDKRVKENICSITGDADKLGMVNFKEFNFIEDDNKIKSYGVIAQDLESVGLENLVVENAEGIKSVDYTALIILELQRLRNEIEELKK